MYFQENNYMKWPISAEPIYKIRFMRPNLRSAKSNELIFIKFRPAVFERSLEKYTSTSNYEPPLRKSVENGNTVVVAHTVL